MAVAIVHLRLFMVKCTKYYNDVNVNCEGINNRKY